MRSRMTWLLIGLIVIEGLRFIIPVDKLANEIQVLSAIPWVYTAYRMEQLHRKHEQDKRRRTNNA